MVLRNVQMTLGIWRSRRSCLNNGHAVPLSSEARSPGPLFILVPVSRTIFYACLVLIKRQWLPKCVVDFSPFVDFRFSANWFFTVTLHHPHHTKKLKGFLHYIKLQIKSVGLERDEKKLMFFVTQQVHQNSVTR